MLITLPDSQSMWKESKKAPNRKPKTGPNAAMLYMKPNTANIGKSYRVIKNLSCFVPYRCTSSCSPSSHGHRRTSCPGWTMDCRRSPAEVAPTRRTKLDRKLMIWHQGNCFLCGENEKVFHRRHRSVVDALTSNYYALPRPDWIIYWYGVPVFPGPCLVPAPTPADKCCRLFYCRALCRGLARR